MWCNKVARRSVKLEEAGSSLVISTTRPPGNSPGIWAALNWAALKFHSLVPCRTYHCQVLRLGLFFTGAILHLLPLLAVRVLSRYDNVCRKSLSSVSQR